MPFGIAPPAPLAPPPPATGATPNAPVNVALGTGVMASTNFATSTVFGPDVAGIALLANLTFQFLKHFSWFDQHRWWPFALLVICIVAFFLIHHQDWEQAIWKGGAAAGQAAANYAAQKASGLGILEPAANLRGS